MYAITGVTGHVGGAAARALLAAGQPLRAVLRDDSKAGPLKALGAEVAIAHAEDIPALTRAFSGTDGVFVMVPPNFAPDPGFSEARAAVIGLVAALAAVKPAPKVAALSSIGGHRPSGLGLITQVHLLEEGLAQIGNPTAILRPAWFMENSLWDVAPARATGEMASFLGPLDKPYPMIATADIGAMVAQVLTESWSGRRIIEMEGPKRYSQNDVAGLLGQALGRRVVARPVPREQWDEVFRRQGTDWPVPRIDMLDGFNSGWIDFEGGDNQHVIGRTAFETVLAELVKQG